VLSHERSSLGHELFVCYLEQTVSGGDALGLESFLANFRKKLRKVFRWRLVTNCPIRFSSDEAEIGYVVCFSRCVGALQDCLWEDVMELQTMLRTRVIERDR